MGESRMINKSRIKVNVKNKFVILLLALSILINVGIAFAYVNMARELNVAWNNGTMEVAKVGFWLISDYQENKSPNLDNLTAVNVHTQMLFQQLNTATLLPYGHKIIPFNTVQTTNSFLNYETKVVQLMQEELKQSGHISEENLKRWKVINDGLRSMFSLLQEENNKNDPFSPVFHEQVWQKIWADATAALDRVEPLPLPDK